MTETNTELLDRLVVGRSVDGRSRYDAQAKLQLVRAVKFLSALMTPSHRGLSVLKPLSKSGEYSDGRYY